MSASKAEFAQAAPIRTLLSVPLEVTGEWEGMLPTAALTVVERMRQACLDDVRLVPDRQPSRLRIEERDGSQPSIWLHSSEPDVGWIVVDISARDWSKLAYQFGHELGHVMANSWRRDAVPLPPCQWLEEAMVEACSLRGLSRLGMRWETDPPFPNDNAFSKSLIAYRNDIVAKYSKIAESQGGINDFLIWFQRHRKDIEATNGLNEFSQVASLFFLNLYENVPHSFEAVGALNRWAGRSGIGIVDYLKAWKGSCWELGVSPYLPEKLEIICKRLT